MKRNFYKEKEILNCTINFI